MAAPEYARPPGSGDVTPGWVRRWDDVPLEKITEMVSRKVVADRHLVLAQVHLKRGAHVPRHCHDHDQVIYVLEGALACAVGGRELTVSEGEVWSVPAGTRHQAVAIDDTFQLVVTLVDGQPDQ